MARGGKRKNAGRRKNQPEVHLNGAPVKDEAAEIIASVDIPDDEWLKKHPKWGEHPCRCWRCLWRDWIRADASNAKYVWDRRNGRPTQMIHHSGAEADNPIRILVEHIGQTTKDSAAAKAK